MLYIRILLFIHSKCNSLHLPPQSPSPCFAPPLATIKLFSLPVNQLVFCRYVHLCHSLAPSGLADRKLPSDAPAFTVAHLQSTLRAEILQSFPLILRIKKMPTGLWASSHVSLFFIRIRSRQLYYQDNPHPVLCAQSLSHVQLFMTLRTVAHQAPLSMGFSRKGYWSGLSFPSPGDLPKQGIEPTSPVSPASASGLFYQLSHLGSPNPYPEVKLLVTQSCLTLCDSMDYTPPGSLSMEFSRQEYWSVLPFPSPGDLPDEGI